MSESSLLITMASWEERFIAGSRRVLESDNPPQSIVYYSAEYAEWTNDYCRELSDLCRARGSEIAMHEVYMNDPAKTLGVLHRSLSSVVRSPRDILVDISTMPREMIWQIFSFLDHLGCRIKYAYHSPTEYNDKWLSRDPGRPRLVLKLSGEAQFDRTTTLLVLTGYDVRRTEQLIRFFDPTKTLLGIQGGDQFRNDVMNKNAHSDLVSASSSVSSFMIDAYAEDRGRSRINAVLRPISGSTNVVATSLGPKLSAVALYQVHRENPSIGLAYAPSNDFNRHYSSGFSKTFVGVV